MRTDALSNSLSDNNDSEKIRVIVVDDDPFVLQALRAYLNEAQEIEVLSTFGSAKDAFGFLRNYRVDVLITDVRMPGMDGLQLLTKVKQGMPEVAVIVLTSFDDDEAMRTALDRKANGFLLKDSSAEEVVRAVIAAHHGGTTIPPPPASSPSTCAPFQARAPVLLRLSKLCWISSARGTPTLRSPTSSSSQRPRSRATSPTS